MAITITNTPTQLLAPVAPAAIPTKVAPPVTPARLPVQTATRTRTALTAPQTPTILPGKPAGVSPSQALVSAIVGVSTFRTAGVRTPDIWSDQFAALQGKPLTVSSPRSAEAAMQQALDEIRTQASQQSALQALQRTTLLASATRTTAAVATAAWKAMTNFW